MENNNKKLKRYISILLCFIPTIIVIILLRMGLDYNKKMLTGFQLPLQESQVIELSLKSDSMEREMPLIIYLPKGYGDGENYPVWLMR